MSVQQKSRGFTLLEVMLAMTLLSIMVVLLFTTLAICAESWNKGENKIAQVNEKAVVYRFFKRHLPAIKPLWDDFSNDERVFSFQGQSDNFQFVSVFPASSGRKGLHIFEVALDKAEKTTIKVLLKPFYPSAEQGQQWQEETVILLENVAEFELSYFDKKKTGSWQANWQDKKYLPELIKINIVQSDESYWPEMIFALKIKAKNTNINQDKLG